MAFMANKSFESKTTFHDEFQANRNAIEQQIDRISTAPSEGHEPKTSIEDCLARIAVLSSNVKTESPNLPARDQRSYLESIQNLSSRLQKVRGASAPPTKFSFRSNRKPGPSQVTGDVKTHHEQVKLEGDHQNAISTHPQLSGATEPTNAISSESQSENIMISALTSRHITPSAFEGHANAVALTSLTRCFVDMSFQLQNAYTFATIKLMDIAQSLVLTCRSTGAVHMTGLNHSTVITTSHQFRMHECHSCDVYLKCASRPIIEGCSGIRFAPLPDVLDTKSSSSTENKWNHVDDFNWLRSDPSPHWSVLAPEDAIRSEAWTNIVLDGTKHGLEGILKAVGIPES